MSDENIERFQSMKDKKIVFYAVALFVILVSAASPQTTVYNNFGPEHEGWDYNYSLGWTVAGDSVQQQYGVEQAMGFQSTVDGLVTFFYVPSSALPDTVTIRLAANPYGLPPDFENVLEEWTLTEFESWSQWDPPHHLIGNGTSQLGEGENYWLWAIGSETTWTGWCMNIDPGLTCPHTLRREGENWLPIAQETASAFRVDLGPISAVSLVGGITPQTVSLAQNYPNPFNPTTTIQYNLAAVSHIQLDIFNQLGQKVTTLVNQIHPAGSYLVTWDARNLASGTYFCTLQTIDYTETKMMLLTK